MKLFACSFGLEVFGDDNKIHIKRSLSTSFNLHVVGEGLECGELKSRACVCISSICLMSNDTSAFGRVEDIVFNLQ